MAELLVTYETGGAWEGGLEEFLARQDLSEFVTRRIKRLHVDEKIRLNFSEAEVFTIERTA
jgi:hypothetical protein